MSATLPKPPSLIASRTQTISSVSFEDAPATQPTRGEATNKAFATPAHRKVPETPLGPTPPKPSKEASDHLDVKTPPRVKAKNVTPSPDCPRAERNAKVAPRRRRERHESRGRAPVVGRGGGALRRRGRALSTKYSALNSSGVSEASDVRH